MVRIARLSLLSRIMCKAPVIVTNLIYDLAAVIGWPREVKADLRWLSGSEKFAGDAERSFKDWGGFH